MAIVHRRNKAELPEEGPKGGNPGTTRSSLTQYREKFTTSESSSSETEDTASSSDRFSKKLRAAGQRPRKKKVLGDITYGEVEDAILKSAGQLSSVARILRCSVDHVKGIFKRNKLLDIEFREFREQITDEVEGALLEKIRNGDTTAMLFYLKCHGKERGYVERAETTASKRGVRMKIVSAADAKKKKSSPNVVPFARSENG